MNRRSGRGHRSRGFLWAAVATTWRVEVTPCTRRAGPVTALLASLFILFPSVAALSQSEPTVFKAGERVAKRPPGRWRTIDYQGHTEGLTDDQQAEIERLRSGGYLTGSVKAPALSGVTIHDSEAAGEGFNFYTSGHFPGAILTDMEGNVLHRWTCKFLDAWPEKAGETLDDNAEYWRRAHLFENGDVLVVFEGHGLVKLDRDSNVLWKRLGGEHNDVKVMDDGSIYALSRVATTSVTVRPGAPILENFVVILDSSGEEIRSASVLGAFLRSEYANVLEEIQIYGDIFNINAVEVLRSGTVDGVPEFTGGSVLLSLCTPNLLAVFDMELGEITWISREGWVCQHDPSITPEGTILLFDNRGHEERSRLIEFDPATGEHVWTYEGATPDDFFSETCGAVQRLPNGNTLATESDRGRVIEIAPDGSIVWEYLNPERAGNDRQLIATVFEMVRLPSDFPLDWLGNDD